MISRFAFLTGLLLTICSTSVAQDGEEFRSNSLGMTFSKIPAGEFTMGRSQPYGEILRLTTIRAGVDRAINTEVPQHKVRVSSFLMQTTEVTQQQWEDVMGTRPWHKKHSFVKEGPNFPAQYIAWDDAVEFCQRLSNKDSNLYRLPTEAEWEYSCRAGTSTIYSFGNNVSDMPDYGWIDSNAYSIGDSFAHKVAGRKPNPWGLHDMHGNVWEWCGDWHSNDFYAHSPVNNPQGPSTGTNRVIRGGSWRDSDTHARSTYRFGFPPTHTDMNIGFRVVCELPMDSVEAVRAPDESNGR